MTSLPPPLEAWRPWLGGLDPVDVRVLGPWLARLRALLGPLRLGVDEGDGEPDGFGGIGRRGPYERLLLSEWALADTEPLEFLRRAAQGEHLFLEPRRRAAGASGRSIVLFDCGPDQLGAPRLAHAVALLAFARRADEAGVAFRWGALQGGALREEVGADGLRALMRARTTEPADPERVAERIDALTEDVEADDVWVVGAERSVPAAGSSRTLVLDETLDGAELRARVGARAPVRLPLPEAAAQVRLLRALEASAARPVGPREERIEAASGLFWCQDGRRLLGQRVRDGARRVVAWHVPPKPPSQPGHPKVLDLGDDWPVAVGFRGRKFSWIAADGGAIEAHVRGKGRVLRRRQIDEPTPGWFAGAGVHPMWLSRMDRQWSAAFVDAMGWLWFLRAEEAEPRLVEQDVIAFFPKLNDELIYAACNDGSWTHLVRVSADGTVRHAERLPVDGRFRVYFGYGGWRPHPQLSLAAAGPHDGGTWWVWSGAERGREWSFEPRREEVRQLTPGAVVGVARDPRSPEQGSAGLLVLDADERTLRWEREEVREIVRFPAPATAIAANPHRPQVAAAFADGSFAVYMLETGEPVLVGRARRP